MRWCKSATFCVSTILLINCVELGLRQGPAAFDKYVLWDLNHVAVANICQFGGRFREEPSLMVGS